MIADSLDLRKLRAFQLVARYGGLNAAAQRLRLTTPAVSFQIRRLEKELGVELFQRRPHGLVLTSAGQNLLQATTGIFEQVEGALATVTAGSALKGQLSISTTGDIVGYFTPKISGFIKRYPEISLRHHIYNSVYTLRLVSSGSVDIGIGYFPKLPSTLKKDVIVGSTISLICSAEGHPFRRAPIRLDDLARQRMVLPPGQSSTRKLIDRTFKRSGIKFTDVIETGSCQTARDFVANGVGPAIVHSLCVGYSPPPSLRYIDISAQFGKVDFSVIYRRENSQSPLVRAFVDLLLESDD